MYQTYLGRSALSTLSRKQISKTAAPEKFVSCWALTCLIAGGNYSASIQILYFNKTLTKTKTRFLKVTEGLFKTYLKNVLKSY